MSLCHQPYQRFMIALLVLQAMIPAMAQATTVASFAQLVQEKTIQDGPKPSGFYNAPSSEPAAPKVHVQQWALKRYPGKPAGALAATVPGRLTLTQGQSKVITLPKGAIRVSVSDPAVVGVVVVSPWQVQVIGRNRGLTNLLVWEEGQQGRFKTFTVTVERDVTQLTEQIHRLAPSVQVQPTVAQDTLILSGEVDTPETAQLVLELAKAYFSQPAPAAGNGGSGAPPAPSGSAASGGSAPSPASGASPSPAGGGSATPPAGGASTAAGSAPAINSNAPGSAQTGATAGPIINLMHVKGTPSTKVALVRQQLRALHPNIHLEVVSAADQTEKAVLTGRVSHSGQIAKALNLTSVYYGQPGIKILAGPGGNAVRATAGNNEFQNAEGFNNNLDINLMQGMILTDTSGKVVSLMELDHKPQIRASIKILEVSHKATNLLGMPLGQISFGNNFVIQNDLTPVGAPAANRQGLAGLVGGTVGIRSGDLNLTLQALEQKQLVRSLAEPTITTLSGEKGSFLAGGEIPIPISDTNGRITLEYKEFGIRLNMVSTVTDDGKINLQVAPEVSSIDPSLSFNSQIISIPGIRSRRMQTTVELVPGQSFVLAGLFSSADAEAMSKFPGLGSIPILGALAKSNLRDKTDSELVVIIRPEIVTTADVATPSGTTGQ
jgi:Flp pilus assembly secretin CpaC